MKKKGLDKMFLQYGIRLDDMQIIEQTCRDCDIDAEWMKENILKAYHDKKNSESHIPVDSKEATRIIKSALKNLP